MLDIANNLEFWLLCIFSRNCFFVLLKLGFEKLYFCMHLGSLLNGREDEFSRDLYNLSQRPIFDVIAFEDLVDKIRSCVAEVIVCIVCHLLEILLTSATTDSLEYYLGALLVTAPNRCSSDCYEHRNRCIVLSMLRTGGCLLSLTS